MNCLLLGRPSDGLPLRWAFLRGSLSVTLLSVAIVGLSIMLVSVFALRAYSQHNLRLIARSIVYTVEAAVLFNDIQATEEGLQTITKAEAIAEAKIYDGQGTLIVHYQRPKAVVSWLADDYYNQPIVHNGLVIGEVRLLGDSSALLSFIVIGLAAVLLSLLGAAVSARYLSRLMVSKVVEPLESMTRVARAIRHDRNFTHRLPQKNNLVELNDLSEDFNALLEELHTWQTHIKLENSLLTHKARHDDLTGLPNRSFFEYRLSLVLQEAARQKKQAALLFIDCDKFKAINDSLGHSVGDKVLVEVAARIRRQLRESDLVARLGGDEFAVLIYPVPKAKDALRIADSIAGSMNKPIVLDTGDSIYTSLSIGIALYPQHSRSAESLLNSADAAMYVAKRGKRSSRK